MNSAFQGTLWLIPCSHLLRSSREGSGRGAAVGFVGIAPATKSDFRWRIGKWLADGALGVGFRVRLGWRRMVKREKEKQEVERELEVYRKKLSDYETREKNRVLKKSRDGFLSPSCSNAEDSDGLSIDLNQELKVLEEKLVTLDDENKEIFEDVNGSDDFHENGHSNGYLNGKHYPHRRISDQKGRSLLPLFDAIGDEEDGEGMMMSGNGVDHDSCESNFEMKNKRGAIEEEVEHLYERLQALEADREFLKYCISSLKKGDKGMDLLQEILQHLRDLRNVELRVRNFGDEAAI
ncbi:hypothetical protein CASFOL_036550 [Castilleja foliolosa]|uniref:Uncharacterized protein n=1 Tax=Castilleja foliolosa TaxID=1961234 RepID=A0ABD3BVY7_9LAMI